MIGIPSGWERRAAAHTTWLRDGHEITWAFYSKLMLRRVNEPWHTDEYDPDQIWLEYPE